jgi:glycosyltransferase involved in cell wall biosynthesis
VQSITNLVHEFSDGINYRIFCGHTDLDGAPLAGIETGKWIRYNDHTEVWYAIAEDRSKTLIEQVEKTKPDLLYIIGIYDWHFNIVPLLFCKGQAQIVSVRGMLHPGALQQKKMKKQFFLGALRMLGLHRKIAFHATDDAEKKFIEKHFGEQATVHIASNFPRTFQAKDRQGKPAGKLSLCSIALVSPMKNHLQVIKALNEVKADVIYNIYGPVKDMAYWQQCLAEMEKLPANIRASYHGELRPTEVEAILKQHDVFIQPSESENFGHAIYEALSAGLPVISSLNTPWNNLEALHAGLNVEPKPGELAAAIEQFARMDNDAFEKWSRAAVAYAEAYLDTEGLQEAYRAMFGLSE